MVSYVQIGKGEMGEVQTIVLTYGTWDLFHYGHYFFLKRAKALGDKLIVGVSTDKMCEMKGKVTILDEETRVQIINDLKFVDKVILERSMKQKVDDVKKILGGERIQM